MPNGVRRIILLFLGEGIPPISEFVGELDFPRHTYSMPYTEYSLASITLRRDVSLIPMVYDQAEHRLGPVEIVVNNVAYWETDTFVPSGAELDNKLVELWTDRPKGISANSFDRLFAVNTRAPALAHVCAFAS